MKKNILIYRPPSISDRLRQLYDEHFAKYGVHPKVIKLDKEYIEQYLDENPVLKAHLFAHGYLKTWINNQKWEVITFRGVPIPIRKTNEHFPRFSKVRRSFL